MNRRSICFGQKMWASLAMALCLGVLSYFTFRAEAANPQGQTDRVGAGQAQQPTENLPELQARQSFELGAAPQCPKPPVEYVGGILDSFGGGADPVALSPQLTTFLSGKPVRKFDEGGPNKLFGYSFRPRENCKICAVQLEVKMKAEGDSYTNDKIYLYGKDINGNSLGGGAANNLIWAVTAGDAGTTTKTYNLPASSIASLNYLVFNNAPGHWINFVAQDDHSFDYVKLRIWYY